VDEVPRSEAGSVGDAGADVGLLETRYSARTSSTVMPSAIKPRISDTQIRWPLIVGRPPAISGLTTIRSSRAAFDMPSS
jgi:hypothetical protein